MKRSRKRDIKRKTRRMKRKQYGGNPKCIYVDLLGGLGNQLFIYATALALSKKTGSNLCLVIHDINPHSKKDYRDFMKGQKIEYTPEFKSKLETIPLLVPKPDMVIKSFVNGNIKYNNAKIKNTQLAPNYYQNFEPIMNVLIEVYNDMMDNEFKKDKYRQYDLANPNECAFMHIRRGDYVGLGWSDSPEYFINALKEVAKHDKVKKIYVLSDDLEWCKQQMPNWQKLTTKEFECKDIQDELESFYFMTQCKGGAIVPSSTFSTWAGMLGAYTNPDSVLIYPKKNTAITKVHHHMINDNVYKLPSRWIGL